MFPDDWLTFILSYNNLSNVFTPQESPVLYGGDEINKDLIPYRKDGV